MSDCKTCENKKWKDNYVLAQQRFDKYMTKAAIGLVIAFTIAIICLLVTTCLLLKTLKFINEFEYVEETCYQIEQDCHGENTVILNEKEVETNGTEANREKKEILEKEKNNTITINK
jgi:hypothetical protein